LFKKKEGAMIVSREKIPLPNEQAVAELLRQLLNKEDSIAKDREHFWIISLDSKNKVKFVELVSLGTVNTCLVHPREVFRRALKKGAVSIIIGHNHPSGDPTPSEEDLQITQKIKQGADLLSVPLLDHIIIGNTNFSFKASSLI
jgi:DNA repair protein RadC